MDKIFNELMKLIHSDTMRKFLTEKYEQNDLYLSDEDILSMAYNSGNSMEDIRDFFRLMLPEITNVTTSAIVTEILEEMDCLTNMNENAVKIWKSEYDEETDTENIIFYPTVEAAAESNTESRVVFVHLKGEKFVSVIYSENKLISYWFYANALFEESLKPKNPLSLIKDRYFPLPSPFSVGDTVYFHSDPDTLFTVVDGELPPYSSKYDYVDASLMIVPFEFHELVTEEYLEERKKKMKPGFYDPEKEYDFITEYHEHMYILEAEMYNE